MFEADLNPGQIMFSACDHKRARQPNIPLCAIVDEKLHLDTTIRRCKLINSSWDAEQILS